MKVETCWIIWSLQIVTFDSEEHKKMTAVGVSDSSLASKCLDFCQVLASQGTVFNFSLSIGSTFSFSLDTRNKTLDTKVGPFKKKKPSPSTLRRNARRREEFLKKKQNPAPSSSAAAQVGAFQLLQPPDGRRRVMSVGRIEMPPISFHSIDVTSSSSSPHPPPQPSPASSSTPTNSFSVKCYLHQKGPTPGKDQQGLECEETFDNESDVMTHMAEVHGGNLCIVCSKTSHCGCKKRVTELENFLYPSNWLIIIISCGIELLISYHLVSAQSLWTLVQ